MKTILICPPDNFSIEYEINPWMKTSNIIDKIKVFNQYTTLKDIFNKLNLAYKEITPNKGLPDQVFTTDVGLVFKNTFIKANFLYGPRKKEADIAESFFRQKKFKIETLPEDIYFEGGDVVRFGDRFFLGYGKRTSYEAAFHIQKIINKQVVPVKLDDPYFYHLDTLFSPINKDSALIYKKAISFDEFKKITKFFKNVIEVSDTDSKHLACNNLVFNKNIILPEGVSFDLINKIKSQNLQIHKLDFSEYLKGGGGIHCVSLEMH
jgi:N-dimethylarginine dimethylaminohydrolase